MKPSLSLTEVESREKDEQDLWLFIREIQSPLRGERRKLVRDSSGIADCLLLPGNMSSIPLSQRVLSFPTEISHPSRIHKTSKQTL